MGQNCWSKWWPAWGAVRVCGGCRRGAHRQQGEHGLAHVEPVPPVVVGDGAVPFPHGVHPPGENLSPTEDNAVQTLERIAKGWKVCDNLIGGSCLQRLSGYIYKVNNNLKSKLKLIF